MLALHRDDQIWARLVVYLAAGIVLGVGIMLGLILHMQDEYDHWAHRGILYYRVEAPVPHVKRLQTQGSTN